MSRRCSVSGKGIQVGNNVSHANNKTRRRFLPNLQNKRLMSEVLGQMVRLTISTSALRTIDAQGGLDAYLMKAKPEQLDCKAMSWKRRIEKRHAAIAQSKAS